MNKIMSYLVLARKYRPQTFADVVGQEVITQTLQNAIRLGRVHHAFLFCGARGTGKTTMARILAKALSCQHAPTATPCNQCEACVEISQGTSIDVQEIDAASQNKVEDVRELRDAIRYAPVRGKKKIFILDEVHMLSTSAFNALLKTLEEPPPHAVFIFATTDPHKLPQTILSRVQRYDFRLVPLKTVVLHLASLLTKEGISFEKNALSLIAKEGGGSIRDALSLLDQVLAAYPKDITEQQVADILGVADRTLIFKISQAILQKDAEQALLLLDQASLRGYDLVQFAKALTSHFRDLVMIQTVSNAASFLEVTEEELVGLKQQADLVKQKEILLFSQMLRLAEDTARSSLPRFFLEIGIVDLCHMEPTVPLDELFNRLDRLEQKLGPHLSGSSQNSGSTPIQSASQLIKPSIKAPLSNTLKAEAAEKPSQQKSISNASFEPQPVVIQASEATVLKSSSVIQTQQMSPSFENWEPIARNIMEKSPLLHVLAMSHPIKWDDSSLVLGMSTPFLVDQLKAKRHLLQEYLQNELGKEIQIEIQVATNLPETKESLLEVEQRREEENKQQKQNEAIKHPARKILADVFGDGILFRDPILE